MQKYENQIFCWPEYVENLKIPKFWWPEYMKNYENRIFWWPEQVENDKIPKFWWPEHEKTIKIASPIGQNM